MAMALDTSIFTPDGDGKKVLRRTLQTAVKDINAVLVPSPKLNFIGSIEFLTEQVINSIAACVGDKDGQPVWTDPRAGNLNPDTIALYEYLVGQQAAEPGAEAAGSTAATAAHARGEDIYLAEDEECPGWIKSAGPTNPKYEAICAVCSRKAACADRAEKVIKEPKPPKEPSEPKYSRASAFIEALKTGGNKQSLAEISDKLYVQKTGKKSNLPEAKFWVANYLRLLLELNLVTETEGVFTSDSITWMPGAN